MPSKNDLNEWLIHYQVRQPAQGTALATSEPQILCWLRWDASRRTLPQQCWCLLNQRWFFKPYGPVLSVPAKQRFHFSSLWFKISNGPDRAFKGPLNFFWHIQTRCRPSALLSALPSKIPQQLIKIWTPSAFSSSKFFHNPPQNTWSGLPLQYAMTWYQFLSQFSIAETKTL